MHYTSKSYTKRGSYKSPRFFCFLPEDIAVFFGIPTGRRGMKFEFASLLGVLSVAQIATLLQVQDLNRNPEADMSLGARPTEWVVFSRESDPWFYVGFNELAHKDTTQKKIWEKLNEVKLVAVGRKGPIKQE